MVSIHTMEQIKEMTKKENEASTGSHWPKEFFQDANQFMNPVETTNTVLMPGTLPWQQNPYDVSEETFREWSKHIPSYSKEIMVDTQPAKRADGGKARWDLIPFDALDEIVQVFTFGAAKYGDFNWQKGMSWSRCFGSTMRHLSKWWQGEDKDPESGLSHLAHAATNIIFLMYYSKRSKLQEFDDRPGDS